MTTEVSQIDVLKAQAAQAVKSGRMNRAEQLWLNIAEIAPRDVDALFALGFHAQIKGDKRLAIQFFRAAVEYSPPNPLFRLTVANALRANEDVEGHLVALTAALDADPYYLPAHFARADALHAAGSKGQAVQVYRDVLRMVGPRENWPLQFLAELEKAQSAVHEQGLLAKDAYLNALKDLKSIALQDDWARMDEAAAILAGTAKVYHQEPIMLHIPRLPAIPFYANADFAWVEALEAQSQTIIDELLANMADAQDLSVPYVAYAPGVPVNQWATLNHSERWSALFFYKNGEANSTTHTQFPKTSDVLRSLPLAQIKGFCPNVMISTLAAKSTIPPHTGETNARLVVHLPLIVPENCRYRVGNEWRSWEVGKALIFDDSIEHEAINDSDEPRLVLIFDIWNPYLTAPEREGVCVLLAARNLNLES